MRSSLPVPDELAKRDVIRRAVVARPGTTIAEAAIAAGVTHPTASYHLFNLEREGHVESHRHANKRLYFEARRFDAWERSVIAELRSRETAVVLAAVVETPWSYLQEVAERGNVSRLTVAAAARRLGALGLVSASREGRTRTLVPDKQSSGAKGAALMLKLPPEDPARALLTPLVA